MKTTLMNAPYTIFGKTKMIPVKVYLNNKEIESDTWDEEWWIEREEDWYGLMSSNTKDKKVRIIERDIWIKTEPVEENTLQKIFDLFKK